MLNIGLHSTYLKPTRMFLRSIQIIKCDDHKNLTKLIALEKNSNLQ